MRFVVPPVEIKRGYTNSDNNSDINNNNKSNNNNTQLRNS